jgi:hypothetical protein
MSAPRPSRPSMSSTTTLHARAARLAHDAQRPAPRSSPTRRSFLAAYRPTSRACWSSTSTCPAMSGLDLQQSSRSRGCCCR